MVQWMDPGTPPVPLVMRPDGTVGHGGGGSWGGTWQGPSIYGRNAGSFDVSRYFPRQGDYDELFWQQNPDMAYQTAVGREARPDTHYNAWLAREQQGVLRGWTEAGLKNPGLLFTDYVPGALRDLATRYTQLPTWQQGQNPAAWFAGRRL